MPSLAYFVVQPHPFLIRFSENFGIRYYGLGYLAGFLIALWLFRRYYTAGRTPLTPAAAYDLLLALVIGVIAGGRLGYFLLYRPGELLASPLTLFRVWEGGMASHGGMLGVALALAWFARTRKMDFGHLADLVVSTAPAGIFLVRVANFLNGELWGRSALVPWAVVFPLSAESPHTPLHLIIPRHPSQLYEAALEGLLLLVLMQWRFWRTDIVQRQPGRLAGEFLLAYAAVRTFCELYREPDAGLILGLSRGTFYSVFLVAGGLALILRSRRRSDQPGSGAAGSA